jgi:hypothetical protein
MNGPIKVFDRDPKDCNVKEIGDFKALVLAGGEVIPDELENRVRSAPCGLLPVWHCCT